MRARRKEFLHAECACLSLFGGAQPKALLQFMAKARAAGDGHDGFLQRFGVLVFPTPQRWVRPSRPLDTAARDRAHAAIKALVHLDFNSLGARPGAGNGGIAWVPMSAEARQLFGEWLDRQAEREAEDDETEAHLSKHRKLVPALALILTVADYVARRTLFLPWLAPNGIGEIGANFMQAAIELGEYFAAHARKLYAAGSARMGTAHRLAEAILAGKPVDGLSVAGLVRAHWAGRDEADVAQAVDVLAISMASPPPGQARERRTAHLSDRSYARTSPARGASSSRRPRGLRIKAHAGAELTGPPFKRRDWRE